MKKHGSVKYKKHRLLLSAAFLLLASAIAFAFLSGTKENATGTKELPAYAKTNKYVAAAYAYAMENPEILEKIPCYCGCYMPMPEHGGFEHRNNKNCYLKDDGSWEKHGSECDVCVYITLEVKEALSKDLSIKQVRDRIDARYHGRIPTNTPPLDDQGNFIRG